MVALYIFWRLVVVGGSGIDREEEYSKSRRDTKRRSDERNSLNSDTETSQIEERREKNRREENVLQQHLEPLLPRFIYFHSAQIIFVIIIRFFSLQIQVQFQMRCWRFYFLFLIFLILIAETCSISGIKFWIPLFSACLFGWFVHFHYLTLKF